MGSGLEITQVALTDLRIDVLPEETRRALRASVGLPFLQPEWYLAGGTALALQIGHRSSEDLDFFTKQRDFDVEVLERELSSLAGDWTTTQTAKGTLYGIFYGAKISFIAHPFFEPSAKRLACGTVHMLVPDDIMAMKVLAISQRGRKRDFVDMYWYGAIHRGSLLGAIQRAVVQFPGKQHNIPHLIKSLTYFADAEDDPMPKLNFDAEWEEIKKYFKREMPKVAEELLGLKP